ncbi:DUF1918 domain-containing protein [Saccharothrix longispora]|uniref:DUF1918 domain-containing protein n=1 Tax=Saccharothrix longispora TaxID=33920 RepID=UPI0028FD4914|nr:DUF1918 domain-containing protein [Saccharothrix longispora]MDU0287734.1 DUF1918 domain-containing protein [Saccharothrix longispora]
MKARVGDWVVVERDSAGSAARRAVVEELRHPDGTPPYPVRWLDTEKRALLFPGPDTHVVTAEEEARRVRSALCDVVADTA